MKILVTGGSGFLGGHLVERLRGLSRTEVVAPPSSLFDLTRREDAERMVDEVRPNVVVHLAARVGGIGANRLRPGTFFRDNALMGIHLIEACRAAIEKKTLRSFRKFVQLGTICAYPKFTPVPFREEDLWNGYPEETNAPYGVAKKALLVMLQGYRQEFDFPGVYLLPVNLYGPRDNFDLETSHVIPAMIRKFVEARAEKAPVVTLWGDGSPTREFLYVADAADAVIAAMRRYDGAGPVNLGSGQEIAIRDLAEMIRRLVGWEGQILWDSSQPNGQPRRRLDTSRALAAFGWKATTTLADGLRATLASYTAGAGLKS